MPNCFRLYLKNSGEAATLCSVDEAICAHLGVKVNPTKYVAYWFDTIGFPIAMGKTLDQIIEKFGLELATANAIDDQDSVKYWQEQLTIAEYLNAHYTTDAWAEIGRR